MVHLKTSYNGIANIIRNDNGNFIFSTDSSDHLFTVVRKQNGGYLATLAYENTVDNLTFFIIDGALIGEGYEADQTPYAFDGFIDKCRLRLVLKKVDRVIELILR